MEKKHHYFLDYIRVIGTCFVVFMHAASSALRYNVATPGENWHLVNGATSLAFCAVPLFFMVSGFCCLPVPTHPTFPTCSKNEFPAFFSL